MKTHTTAFKNNIKKFGRQIDSVITYTIDGVTTTLGKEDLNGVTPTFNGNILKSCMKELDIDSNVDIPIGTEINYQFGIKVNNEYEYLDFGNYIVYSSEKQEDTFSYNIVCYDKMIYSMKEYENLNITYPITIRSYINAIATKLGLTFANNSDEFANYEKQILSELYLDAEGKTLGYTYRDVLDELAQVTASTICINAEDEIEVRYLNNTQDTIDEEYLKDVNVKFGETYGPINVLTLSRSADADIIRYPEELPENPVELKISNNQILNGNDRSTYMTAIYSVVNGLTYSINDYTSTGICYYDLCDRYYVRIGENTYPCIMLNDTIEITQGLEEKIYTEKPDESVSEYKYTSTTDQQINQTYLIVNKQNQTIEAVITNVSEQDTKISQISQTVDEINAKIQDITDITVSGESTMANVQLLNVNESEPIIIKIRPIGQNISYLYPRSNLYPSSSLYSTTRTLMFHNTTTDEYIPYPLPEDLLVYSGSVYDEFNLGYETQTCTITKRCEYDAQGNVVPLAQEETHNIPYPSIILTDGDYEVYLVGYTSGYIYVTLMASNIYTTQFYTKAETNSQIQQKADDINISVDQKLSNYSTTEETSAQINIGIGTIRSEVSTNYETKSNAQTQYSRIDQTTNSLTTQVGQKVGNNEIISKINQTPEAITINANKISLTGKNIALTTDGITISSTNFNVDTNGNLTCNNANVTGTINAGNGRIGGWTLGTNTITSGNTTLTSGGRIAFSNGNYFFGVGAGSAHPVMSALSTRNVNYWSSLSASGASGTWIGGTGIYGNNLSMLCNAGQQISIGRAQGSGDSTEINESYILRFTASTANWTIRTDGISGVSNSGNIYLRPKGNDSLYVYGSYNNNLGYHYGRSGMIPYLIPSGVSYRTNYLYFVNGIYVGNGGA